MYMIGFWGYSCTWVYAKHDIQMQGSEANLGIKV